MTSSNTRDLTPLLTPVEVSTVLKVSKGTLAKWRHLRRGPPYVKVGRYARYHPEKLSAWIAEHEWNDSGDAPTLRGVPRGSLPS